MGLKDDLYDVFTAMNDSPSDDDFAQGIGDVIKTFVSGCTLQVVPPSLVGADTAPPGNFTGAATVSWQITGSKIADKIKAVLTEDMTDADLADAIADGLDDDAPQWTASLTGTTVTTTTPPVSAPASDQGSINSTFVSAPVSAGMKAAFATMEQMINEGDDGNDFMATQLATLVSTYYASSVNVGQGQSHLSGVAFTVVVVPGS